MRLQPVASQAVRRVVTRDVRLRDGRPIPAGTTITGSNFSMMRNPAWGWGANACEFVPVRTCGFREPHVHECPLTCGSPSCQQHAFHSWQCAPGAWAFDTAPACILYWGPQVPASCVA